MLRRVLLACLSLTAIVSSAAQAGPIMPDFATAPAGWVTDRYEPNSFTNVGTFGGRSNVIGIGIARTEGATARPAGQQGTFYNTQGRQYQFGSLQGPGSILSADLWIANDWADGANGNVRSDLWGRTNTTYPGPEVDASYPIIGFTNYGGAPRFRVWDADTANGWVDLATPVAFGTWAAFGIEFTGVGFVYYVNGTPVYTDNTILAGTSGFTTAFLQAYNFFDTSINGAVGSPYTAHWSNTQVPEPGALLLLGLGLVAGGRKLRRRA